jgi:hypothetical protein
MESAARDEDFSPAAARLGIGVALAVLVLSLAYAAALVLGLRALPSPREPIPDPYFAVMELLILLIAPALVVLMAAVHAYAPRDVKVYSLTGLVFMGLLTGTTGGVHMAVLTVGRQITPAELPGLPVFLAFRWPSVIYALDILAWDFFYPLAVLFAAGVFRGGGLARAVRVLLLLSGVLSLAGMIAPAAGDMDMRMIGIAGYAGLLPVVSLLLALEFRRAAAGMTRRAPRRAGGSAIKESG